MNKGQIVINSGNDKERVSEEAKKVFRRPAYQGTRSEAKSYSQHILDRFTEVK